MNLHRHSPSWIAVLTGMLLGGPAFAASLTCPAPASSAFTGCYYNNTTLSGDPVFTRTDSQINFNWGYTTPDPSLPVRNFSVQWQGNFTFNQGQYTFTAYASDGVRLYVDGVMIMNAWNDQSMTMYRATQTLSQGSHLITVQYFEQTGTPIIQVSWQSAGPASPQAPAITSFTSTPTSITAGNFATLTWNVSGATSISINNGIGDVTSLSSTTVSPAQTTTYTLTASNSSGSNTAMATVTVTPATNPPPSAPTLVSATAVSGTEVDLAWTASSSNLGILGYQILRNGTSIATTAASVLAMADTTVSAGTTYTYTVKAYDAAANYSGPSNAIQVTTPGAPPPPPGACPSPVTNAFTGCYYNNTTLSGNPVFTRTDSQISFNWGYTTPAPSLSARNFSVRWEGNFTFNQGQYTFSAIASDGVRIYVDGSMIMNAWYDQTMTQYQSTQTLGQGSHLITVEYFEQTGTPIIQVSWQYTGPASPQAPAITSFTATPASITAGSPSTLAWNVSGATSISINNAIGNVTNLSSVSVSPAQTTTYTLTASNSTGSNAATATVTVTPGTSAPPTAPILVSATAVSATEVDLTWTASTSKIGIGGYQILRNGAAIGTSAPGVLTMADTTVTAATNYTYTIKAYDTAGNYSSPSNAIQVTTPPANSACPAPATNAFTGCYYNNTTLSGNPVFIRTDSQINFSWGYTTPDPSLPARNFSVRWQGNFTFNQGQYTFTANASDGIRLYVDGNMIVNAWNDQSMTMYRSNQTLSQGSHLIAVEYFEQTGTPIIQVSWQYVPPVPVITSFTATPSSIAAGNSATLAWNVSGATSISINNGIGIVTNFSSAIASPTQTTTYTLTASNNSGSSTAMATVTVTPATGPPPTVPTLLSATPASATDVDLSWTASASSVGIAGYQILRNGTPIGTTAVGVLTKADTTVSASTSYTYTIKAYDTAGNYSGPSNAILVTTPASSGPSNPCPSPGINAFTGCYYNNTTLSGNPVFTRTDSQINFNWGSGSPDSTLTPKNFSVQWQGNFTFAFGQYVFTVVTSDGMRLYVDGSVLLNVWSNQPPTTYTAQLSLGAGTHLIRVDYYEQTGTATAGVSWQNQIQGPPISSFTATPSSITAGNPATLGWNVAGATSIGINNGVGDVTNRSNITVYPSATTTYTLTASNSSGSNTATTTVTVTSGSGQPPTAPTLVSATASSANEVDLVWTASTSSAGVAGYQIVRNGTPLTSVTAGMLTYADTTVSASTTYSYTVNAFDAAGNHSFSSNTIQVTTPLGPSISVTWYGGCWLSSTIYGVTGNFQAVDYSMVTSNPVPVQGTLFYGPTCDLSWGWDNMNDFNTLSGSGHMIRYFTHNANIMPVSAIYWMGPLTGDGLCAPGSPCSGCLHYDQNTPNCSNLP